jgi:phosphatidate cytidylyltransferase
VNPMTARVLVAVLGIPPLLFVAASGSDLPVRVLAGLLCMGCAAEVQRPHGVSLYVALPLAAVLGTLVAIAPALPGVGWLGLAWFIAFHATYRSDVQGDLRFRGVTAAVLWVAPPLLSLAPLQAGAPDGAVFDFRWTPLVALFLVLWASDTAALFVGRSFGKTPLARHISPNKTMEGAVGGILAGVLAGGLAWANFRDGSVVTGALFGAVVATSGMLGDLAQSRWKRFAGIKDSGALLPGHGGLLDRFDSLLLAAPVAHILTGWLLER